MTQLKHVTSKNFLPTSFEGSQPVYTEQLNAVIDQLNNVIGGTFFDLGAIDCSANPNYPAMTNGQYYNVSVAGKIGGGSGTNVEAGDRIYCITDSLGGTELAVGTSYLISQVNIDPSTIAQLRTGTANNVYVTPKTLADGGFTFATTTPLGISGGTTQQLSLTATAAQLGLYISQTAATTGYAISISSAIADTTTRQVSASSSMSTAFTTAKTLYGYYHTHTTNGTDVDGALVAGHVSYLGSTALSKVSYYGFKSLIVGTLSATSGTQLIASYFASPTCTINSATTTLTGVHIDLSGVTNTSSAAIYGLNILGFSNIGMAYGNMSTPITLPTNPGATIAGQTINILHSAGAGNCDDLLASYCKIAVTGSGDSGLTIVGSAPRAYVGVTGGANNSVASAAYASQPWVKHEGTGAITAMSALSAMCNVGADNFTASTVNSGHFHVQGAATVTGQFDGVMIEVYPGVTSIDSFLAMAADGSAAVPTAMRIVGAATVASLFNFDATTASKCVAPNTSAINALTAKVAVKIITNTGTYWLPGFSCTDGTGATFN
jgi:hypothetical protein